MTATLSIPGAPAPARRGRRFFLPLGVSATGGRFRDLPGVTDDVARVGRAFRGLGYAPVGAPANPSAGELLETLRAWLDRARLGRADALVLYFSGHGLVVEGEHYLCPRGFDPDCVAS